MRRSFLVLALTLLAACGSGDGTGPAVPGTDFNGSYSGTFGTAPATLDLVANGADVIGTLTIPAAEGGHLRSRIVARRLGRQITGTLSFFPAGYICGTEPPGTVTAKLNGNELRGTFSIDPSCAGLLPTTTGTFVMTR